MRQAQAPPAQLGQRLGDEGQHEGHEDEAEEIAPQPQEGEQQYPDDDAPVELVELREAEGHAFSSHPRANIRACLPHFREFVYYTRDAATNDKPAAVPPRGSWS